jgi:hypothetical protein
MKKKRFSVEQIVAVLKQVELGVPVAEVIRKVGNQRADLLPLEEAVCWDGDGPGATDETTPGGEQPAKAVGRRSEPGQDDAAGCAQKKVLKPSGRRPLVDHLRDQYRASERHACAVLLMVRGTYRYHGHEELWTELRMRIRIREIAQSRVRYGYRKIRVLLNREGWNVGKHLVYRLYKEEGLALKKRPQRKRKAVRHREERFIAHSAEPGLEYRLRRRSVAGWDTLPGVDGRRWVHTGKWRDRSRSETERRRCGASVEPSETAT